MFWPQSKRRRVFALLARVSHNKGKITGLDDRYTWKENGRHVFIYRHDGTEFGQTGLKGKGIGGQVLWGGTAVVQHQNQEKQYGCDGATALTSYFLLGLTLPILTPVLGTLGRNLTTMVWHVAVSEPPVKRETIFPIEREFIKEYDSRPISGGNEKPSK
jgi:hypothetical protein